MKCFNHDGVERLQSARTCNKAFAHICAADVGNGVACTGACEEESGLNEIIPAQQNRRQRTAKLIQERNRLRSRRSDLRLLSVDAIRPAGRRCW